MIILQTIQRLLARLGCLGSRAITASVIIGIGFPWLGQIVKPYLGEAVFLLLCAVFIQTDMKEVKSCLKNPLPAFAAALWTSIVIPVLFGGACLALGVNHIAPDLYMALVLQAVTSPIMSAPAFAAIMGLDAAFVLISLFCSTALIPFTAPLFTSFFLGSTLTISPLILAGKLFLILFGAAVIGTLIRRLAGPKKINKHVNEINGFNIIILFIFVTAIMENVGVVLLTDTVTALLFTALGFLIFFITMLLSYFVFLPAGRERAISISLMVSQRNMGLMIAATGGILPELTWLYFALAQFPIFLSPQILQPIVKRILAKQVEKT